MKKCLASAALCTALVAPALIPSTAHAWWVRGGWGWRAGIVVAAPSVVAPPPVVAYVPPPAVVIRRPAYTHWVRGHYNWRGTWIPGHWA